MTENPFRKNAAGNEAARQAGRDAAAGKKPTAPGEDVRSDALKGVTDVCPLLTTPALQFAEVPMSAKIQMSAQRDLPAIPVLSMSLNFCIKDSCAMWSAEDGGGCSLKRGMEALYRKGKEEKSHAQGQPAGA